MGKIVTTTVAEKPQQMFFCIYCTQCGLRVGEDYVSLDKVLQHAATVTGRVVIVRASLDGDTLTLEIPADGKPEAS